MRTGSASPERPIQAVILAGGRGTRLKPLTDTRPKPMVVIRGKPFLAYQIEQLRDQGFKKILLLLDTCRKSSKHIAAPGSWL